MKTWLLLPVISLLLFLLLNRIFPLPLPDTQNNFARIITARDGRILRSFADNNGVWRYPVTTQDISPLYLQALLEYEDRWFYYHPGVNPLALLRASWQNLFSERIVSGGSTLTMQVARILDPHSRTLTGKCKQMFRALQLEWQFSKMDILNLYINYAPFGGPLEGVEAASYSYLGKSGSELTHAEAALLTVLPQAPSRLRPDRHPLKAEQARNKVLQRMLSQGVWEHQMVHDAMQENVYTFDIARPLLAPLLARRLKARATARQALQTTINFHYQQSLEEYVGQYVDNLPDKMSAAVLLVNNQNLHVEAYVASADFFNPGRYGHVDMITAIRSPGSALKPFIYGLALDDGLIHSHSLLSDAPRLFSQYRPENFHRGFTGPVSVTEALQRSLNVPAVQVLEQLGPKRLAAALANVSAPLRISGDGKPNPSIALGGVGIKLEELVGAYTSLARKGLAGQLRYLQEQPLKQRRLLSEGSAWIIRNILQTAPRPGRFNSRNIPNIPDLAWKTGTSYGFRDSWAIGVNDNYTVGVWVGRPDGTPMPGYYGANTAAPLLFGIANYLLPRKPIVHTSQLSSIMPSSIRQQKICWPLGRVFDKDHNELCHQQHNAWILDETIPPTFISPYQEQWQSNPLEIAVNALNGRLVSKNCNDIETINQQIPLWPRELEPWLAKSLRQAALIPALDSQCRSAKPVITDKLSIVGLEQGSILRSAGASQQMLNAGLQALGGNGKRSWFINGKFRYELSEREVIHHEFSQSGFYQISVVDEQGETDMVEIEVVYGLAN